MVTEETVSRFVVPVVKGFDDGLRVVEDARDVDAGVDFKEVAEEARTLVELALEVVGATFVVDCCVETLVGARVEDAPDVERKVLEVAPTGTVAWAGSRRSRSRGISLMPQDAQSNRPQTTRTIQFLSIANSLCVRVPQRCGELWSSTRQQRHLCQQ